MRFSFLSQANSAVATLHEKRVALFAYLTAIFLWQPNLRRHSYSPSNLDVATGKARIGTVDILRLLEENSNAMFSYLLGVSAHSAFPARYP